MKPVPLGAGFFVGGYSSSESSMIVTGPSFVRATCMLAPKMPVWTFLILRSFSFWVKLSTICFA